MATLVRRQIWLELPTYLGVLVAVALAVWA
jgi:hypothetical protein